MNINLIQQTGASVCEWADSSFFLFSQNVFSNLIYYSHLLPALLGLVFGILVFATSTKSLTNRALFLMTIVFAIWSFLDLFLWASPQVDQVMFVWSLLIFFDPIIYVLAAYLFYVFVYRRDMPWYGKLLLVLPITPILVSAPSSLNLASFDFTNCEREAVEGSLWFYTYAIEFGYLIWIILIAFVSSGKVDAESRRQNYLMLAGLVLFLFFFSLGNIIGSFSYDWSIAQYGLFGLPFMLGFLTYLIAQYNRFDAKAILVRILSVSQVVFIVSIFFIRDLSLVYIIVGITLALTIALTSFLNRAMTQEVKQRHELQKLATDLKTVNDNQTNLLNFVTHQVKGFFTKTRNIFALSLEGDFGEPPELLKRALKEGLSSDDKGVAMVQELLNATHIRRGTVEYNVQSIDLSTIVRDVEKELVAIAGAKGLDLSAEIAPGAFKIMGDGLHMHQAIRNIVDNAIRYTPQGWIRISLTLESGMAVIRVKDSGVGLSGEDMNRLFTEGGRGKDSRKFNVDSTGYGLYIVKNVIEAHKGTVVAQSEGPGKGSVFTVTLPLATA